MATECVGAMAGYDPIGVPGSRYAVQVRVHYGVMRSLFPFVAVLLLAGCASTALYSQQDLQQVHQAYHLIPNDYLGFKQAYNHGNAAALHVWFQRTERDCRIEDGVDKRDTIDPNIQLFQASALLDSICNDTEAAWYFWEKQHHEKYDKDLVPPTIAGAWEDGDLSIKKLPALLRHPKHLA